MSGSPQLRFCRHLGVPVSPETPNTIFFVKDGGEFNIYVSDSEGTVYPMVSSGGGGSIADTFETINRNISSYAASIAFSGDFVSTVTYSTGAGDIVKTFAYDGELVSSITLSGPTPSGISLIKSFSYDGESRLIGWSYS